MIEALEHFSFVQGRVCFFPSPMQLDLQLDSAAAEETYKGTQQFLPSVLPKLVQSLPKNYHLYQYYFF